MEFSDIQPVSQSGHLQEQFSINSAADLSLIFNSRSNAGDQVEVFLSIAEGQPEIAFDAFNDLVENMTSPPIKSLALQGFGKITQPYKQALALCESKESRKLLKLLCHEVRNRNSHLTAWAAAEALKDIGFSLENIQHSEGGNLFEPPRRIQNEILDYKIQEISRIQRLNSRGQFTAEYERFLEFWIYGPTEQFFSESLTSQKYIEIAEDILDITQIRGIQLGLNASNKKIQELSLRKAESIFKLYLTSHQNDYKKSLGDSLSRFLKENDNITSNLIILANAFVCEEPKQNLDDLTIARLTTEQINQNIDDLKEIYEQIFSVFSSAINISGNKVINSFLSDKKNKYLHLINSWIQRLKNQLTYISSLSASQRSKADLIVSILDSIKGYDEELYLQISNQIVLRLQRLSSSSAKTQEEQNSVNKQLDEIKQMLDSSLSGKLNNLRGEVLNLELSSSNSKDNAEQWLKSTAILLAIGLFAEIVAFVIVAIFLLIALLISAGMSGGGS